LILPVATDGESSLPLVHALPYQYDVFFSYKRDPESDAWHQKVKDELAYWLKMELNRPKVNIFFDTEDIRSGQRWQQN
jgi:hypothetical protein